MTVRRMWCPTRLAAATVLALWASAFWFLLLTGRSAQYLSARTDWVVPVGAAILTAAAIGRVASARTASPHAPAAREAGALALVALPVAVVLALPPVSLGSYAAARRSSLSGTGFGASPADIARGRVTLGDVAGALRSSAGMRALARRAGAEVTFVGFVVRDASMPAGEFELTRFLVSCCVADALSVQVRVVGAPPARFDSDDWVSVTGRLYPLGREVIVDAAEVVLVRRPKHPYLSP